MNDPMEQAIRELPPPLQRRMAHLSMRGWKFRVLHYHMDEDSWTASNYEAGLVTRTPAGGTYWPKLYSSTSLSGLLTHMVGVLEVMMGNDAVADRKVARLEAGQHD